jgi:WD40 repeat protein
MSEAKVNYVKCKASASQFPNNFTSNANYVAYAHRNEVHLVKNDNSTLEQERASSIIAAYAEKGTISQARFCKFSFGDALVIVSQTGSVCVFDESGQKLLASHKLANKTPKENHLRGIASDGKGALYIGCGTSEVLVFDVTAKKMALSKKFEGHVEPVADIAFSGGNVVSGDEHGNVIIWDGNGSKLAEFAGKGHPVTSVVAGHGYAVAGYSTGHIRMFDLAKKTLHVEVAAHTRMVSALCIHPTKPIVGTSSEDTFVSIWSLPSGATAGVANVLQISPAPFLITGVQFIGNNSSLLASTAYDSRYVSMVSVP